MKDVRMLKYTMNDKRILPVLNMKSVCYITFGEESIASSLEFEYFS